MKSFILLFYRYKQSLDEQYGNLSRFVQYALTGTSGLVLYLGLITLFIELKTPLRLAIGLSILIALSWNFMWNYLVTFNDAKKIPIYKLYTYYFLCCMLGNSVNYVVTLFLVESLNFSPQIAGLFGTVLGLGFNFILSRYKVFRRMEAS